MVASPGVLDATALLKSVEVAGSYVYVRISLEGSIDAINYVYVAIDYGAISGDAVLLALDDAPTPAITVASMASRCSSHRSF